jgi:hypothetical protein
MVLSLRLALAHQLHELCSCWQVSTSPVLHALLFRSHGLVVHLLHVGVGSGGIALEGCSIRCTVSLSLFGPVGVVFAVLSGGIFLIGIEGCLDAVGRGRSELAWLTVTDRSEW